MQRRLCVSLVTFLIVVSIPIARGAASNGHGSDRLARINHIVVIYQENHSFDNLYGSWEGVNGLSSAPPARTVQVSQAGVQFSCLQQNDVNLDLASAGTHLQRHDDRLEFCQPFLQ